MGKNGKKLLALLLAIMMVFTVCSPTSGGSGVGTTSAEGSTEAVATSTDANSKARLLGSSGGTTPSGASLYDTSSSSITIYVKVNGEWTDISNVSSVYDGQEVKISYIYTLDESDKTTTTYTINLDDYASNGLTITQTQGKTELSRNGTEVGNYTITDGVVTVIITDDTFLAENGRYVQLDFTGTITADKDITKDGTTQTVSFGDASTNVKVYSNSSPSSASVSKSTSGNVYKSGDTYYQDYTVTITAQNGTITINSLTDYLVKNYDSGNTTSATISNVNVTSVEGNGAEISVETGSYDSLSNLVGNGDGMTLYKGQSITITYTMKVPSDIYNSDTSYQNKIEVDYTPNQGSSTKTSSTANVNYTAPSIKKEVSSYNKDAGTITWTITIDLGDLETGDKSGLGNMFTVTDTLGSYLSSSEEVSASSFTYDSKTKKYTYTYTTTIDRNTLESKISDTTLQNSVSMSSDTYGTYSGKASVTYESKVDPAKVEKEFTDVEFDTEGNAIVTWQVKIANIYEFSYLQLVDTITYDDWYLYGMSITDAKVAVNTNEATEVVKNSEIVSNNGIVTSYGGTNGGCTLTFDSSWLGGNIDDINDYIIVTLTSKISKSYLDEITKNTYNNTAYVYYGTTDDKNNSESSGAEYTYVDTSELVKKTGSQVSGENQIEYTITADITYLTIKDGTSFVFTDTLPEGLSYVEGSAKVALNNANYDMNGSWVNDYQYYIKNLEVSKEGQKITFTEEVDSSFVTLYENNSTGSCSLIITYTAQVTSTSDITSEETKEYENTVSGTYGGSSIGSAEAKTSVSLNDNIVKKSYNYSTNTAPYVEYTVSINPDALTLNGGSTLEATDTLGDQLTFVDVEDENSTLNNAGKAKYAVKVYDANGDDVTSTCGITYSVNGQTVTFKNIPDKSAYTIVYWAEVNVSAGTELTNATNSFALSGSNTSDAADSKSISGVALESSATAGSNTGTVTLYKYWMDNGTKTTLKGSKFTLYKITYSDSELKNAVVGTYENVALDSDGTVTFSGLTTNTLYALYETDSDDGFALNREPYYFVMPGTDTTYSGSLSFINTLNLNVKTWDQDVTSAALDYENEKAGTLVIKKTFAGYDAADENSVLDSVSFTVTWVSDEDGNAKNIEIGTYKVADFSGSEPYTLTLDDLTPGTYKVEETVTSVEGYTTTSEYVVTAENTEEASAAYEGSGVSAIVKAEKTTTIDFTNTYTKESTSATIKIDKTYTTSANVKDVSFGIYYAGTASDYDVVIDGSYYKEYTIVAMDDADFTGGNYVASSTVDTSVAGAYYVYELDANGDPITDSSEVFTLDSSGTYYTVSASGNEITSLSTGDEVTAYFTNTEVADTSISLSATKTLSGGTLTDGMFTFILSDDGSSALQTVTNSGTDVTFADIDYTADNIGTYTYYIYEQDDSVTNFACKYDTTCYKVIVTVALNSAGNGLTTTIAVRKYDTLDYAVADTNNTDNTNGSDVQTAKTGTSFSSMSFTNTAAASLKVSKVLDGSAASTSDKFDFTITLSDDTINETYNATGAVSSVEFTDGVATVTLKGGQYVNIEGLPAGITYSVVEADYTDDGYSTVCTEGSASGTLTAGNTSSVTYTNIKTAGNLEITKTVTGDGASADTTEFDFTVTIADLAGKTVTAAKTGASGSTDIDVKFNSNGVAIVTLMNGESLMFSDLPAGTEYSVKEDDYTSDGYLTTLSGDETGAIEDGKTSTVAYTNKIIDKATLTVTKNLAGNDYSAYLDEEFEITIYLEIGSSTATLDTLATAYEAVKNDTEDTKVSFTKNTANSRVYATIKLKGSDSLTIYDIPVGAKYTVSEADYTGTGYNFDSPKFTYIDENYGTISDDYASSVTITNTRNTYGNLTVSKAIDGNSPDTTKEFAFTVVLSDKTINGSYGDMTFTNGIATFTLKGGDSITAEGLPNGVTYTVTESDYVLDGYQTTVNINSATAVATNVAEGTIVGSATETVTQTVAYTNTKDTYSTLTINKEIAGNDADSNQEFEFEITLSDNSTATYTATGGVYTSVSFTSGKATIKLKGGEYVTITGLPNGTTYTVTEKTADGYVTKVTKTTGTVDSEESAKVSGTINYTTPQSVTYTNTKNTYGDLTISKTVAGNAGSTSDEFEFTIKLSGTTDSSVLNGTYNATSVGASYTKVTFSNGSATITLKDGERVTITGIPNGVTYTVTEEDYAADGYVTTVSTDASGSTYDAGNTVTDTVDGTVGSNTQYYALFKNTNNKQSLTVSKIVSGNDTSEDDYFAFVITITDESDAPLSGTYSGVEFDSDGKATVYLSGGDGLEIELPEGTKYTVVEQTGVYVIDGSEYVEDTTAAAYNLEDVSGTGTTSLADASASGEIEAGTAATAVYTNTRDSFGNLVISKTVSSGDTSKVFAFTIELSDSTVSGYYDCTYTDGEGIETSDVVLFTAGVATVELADGESVTIENLPNGVSYEVTEDDYSQDGYVIASEINSSNTIKGNDTREVIFVNKLTSVSISKVDVADGSELPGATIQIIDSNGNVVDEWVSTDEAYTITGLIPGETYTLRETVAPDGYGIATDTTFVIDKYGNVTTTASVTADGVILVEDALTSVTISKVDIASGEEIPGATIQIIDEDGNVVEEWVSTDVAHTVTGLLTGVTYTLRETVAPDGYYIATDTTFVLDKYGNIDTTQTTTTISSGGVLLVEDWLIETSTTTTTTTTTTTSTTTTSTPDTGDNTPIVPIAVLFGASVAGIFMTLLVKNREKKRNRR